MNTSTLTTENFNEQIYNQAKQATNEVIKEAKLVAGDIMVIGCSSSEIIGETIGQASSLDAAQAAFSGIYDTLKASGIYLAAQCCEHLNRAIIIEKELAVKERMDIVNVVPQPKAGGSFATTAYKTFANPVAVEHIRADAGMDIGDTLIGMHLKDVAVPLRISTKKLGEAHLVCARTRAKFIGGERAVYDERLA